MVKRKAKKIIGRSEETGEMKLLRDLIIIELAKAGVPQSKILKIVKGDIHRVSQIARHFKDKSDKKTYAPKKSKK